MNSVLTNLSIVEGSTQSSQTRERDKKSQVGKKKEEEEENCPGHCSITGKRCHDQGSSYVVLISSFVRLFNMFSQ